MHSSYKFNPEMRTPLYNAGHFTRSPRCLQERGLHCILHAQVLSSLFPPDFPPDSPLQPNQLETSAQALPSNSGEAVQPGAGRSMEAEPQGGQSSAEEPKSPSSPRFSAPPIRNAALKNMFPQVRGQQWPQSQVGLHKNLFVKITVDRGIFVL